MGHVLYRKYRSKSLSDVIGQEHITSTLQSAIKKGLISHAYLFTGPRGVGKTSVARILAYELNNIEYDESKSYVDIIEIDAASNRRIDEIRELRDKITIVPSSLRYKVYIIDEVHMLTREAFNALLKTLEEPPEHAIFILATTELYKVPETIISRCQRFAFKHIDSVTASKRLKEIAKKESIDIDDASIELISTYSGGSFRDALSLLDQLGTLADKVTEAETRAVLGIAANETVSNLVSLMREGDMVSIIHNYRKAIDWGNDPVVLGSQIADYIRLRLNKSTSPREDIVTLKSLLALSSSRHPEAELEIILLSRLAETRSVDESTPKTTPSEARPKKPKQTKKQQAETDKPKTTQKLSTNARVIEQNDWEDILAQIKHKKNTLYSIMRMAKTHIEAGELHLHFAFPFHVKRANDPANKSFLEATIHESGLTVGAIEMIHSKDLQNEPPDNEEVAAMPANDTIMDVFKGAEVIES